MSKNKIENEYKELADQINAKIKEAAAAMKEANKLAKDAGFTPLTLDEWKKSNGMDDYHGLKDIIEVDPYPLFHELDEAGWQTSSIGC
jgi:hypothetical protein